jgi:lipid II isoglutaminyl synthase (glutamine-hydrolysing)
VERLSIGPREVAILLVKNPAGANEVLRTLMLEDGQLDLWIALNDRIADGRDVSWIWDADFEVLAGRVRHVSCSGTRAEEMALRLKYAGVDAPIAVDRELGPSLDAAVAAGNGQPLYVLPTYTALLELRDLLADRGVARRWSE